MKRSRWFPLLSLSLFALGFSTQVGRAFEDNSQPAQEIWRNGSFPVENFQGYTSPFGYRVSPTGGYTTEFHSGLDFAAPVGSYIRGWWTGRVIEVSDNTACGTSVRVQSGSWVHVYCHMQGSVGQDGQGRYMTDGESLRIYEGQTVQSGQRLGRVGMTGRTTGPHLHWTLKYAGKLVDPAIVLRAMYTAQREQPNFVSSQPQPQPGSAVSDR
jgi:murein DD-endopeptidase MepM/ murein hydrolase activator NlpD